MKKLAMILFLVLSSVVILSSQVMAEDASQIEWVNQFGTDSMNYTVGISVDATGVCVARYTYSVFPEQTGASSVDTFIRRYNLDDTATLISSSEPGDSTVRATFGEGEDALNSTTTKEWI